MIVFTQFGNLLTSTELQGIYYYQGKIQSMVVQFFSLSKKQQPRNPNHQKNGFSENLSLKSMQHYSSRVEFSTGSNTTRLHKAQQISNLETSSITNINRNPPKTIPHSCNSSFYSQTRRPTETAHNFNFSLVHNDDRNAASFVQAFKSQPSQPQGS